MTSNLLDVIHTPLEGLNLIEASAGTGKTWTIAALYARLVLERGLRPEQILVVTYTKAATAELRERIRARLVEVADACSSAIEAEGLAALAQRDPYFLYPLLASRTDLADDADRLRAAVSNFDLAAVFTIHGFCQRSLGEHALAAGLELGREFVADESPLLLASADAAFRQEVDGASEDWLRFLLEQKQSPESWLAQLGSWLGISNLSVALPAGGDSDTRQAQVCAIHLGLAQRWQSLEGEQARQWLQDALAQGWLNGRSHRKDWTATALAFWDEWLQGTPLRNPPWDNKKEAFDGKVWRLFGTELAAAQKSGSSVPPLFDELAALAEGARQLFSDYRSRLAQLHARLLDTLGADLIARKQAAGVMSFHDLLVELDAALAGPRGAQLATALQQRYSAALIDEFQDTDPLQFRIFDRLFNPQHAPPQSCAFLVGDPKQAIYAFRGAELNAYLQASSLVVPSRRFSLATNRRSTPELVAAVAALFGQAEHPFLIEQLPFSPVGAVDDKPRLIVDGQLMPALAWHLLNDGEQTLGKGDARALAVTATASQIAVLLSPGRACLDARAVQGGDIAVLASTHAELASLQKALLELGVPSVRISRQSVFATAEAQDLLQVLEAMLAPTELKVRAALFCPLLALSAEDLQQLGQDDRSWDAAIAQYQSWHKQLQTHGPLATMEHWLIHSGTAQRLAQQDLGERRLTNLLHLFELIEARAREQVGLIPLLNWYRAALHSGGEQDERLMRLESDASRVRLVTLHAAKGLEYPIVFCPFLWDGALFKKAETAPLCYEDGQQVLDLGSPQQLERWAAAKAERLAEKLRLLYVALTRPKSACILAWGGVKDMQQSALGWLLAGGRERERNPSEAQAEVDALLASQSQHMAWLDFAHSDHCRSDFSPTAKMDSTHGDALLPTLTIAKLKRHLNWRWRMSSFSGLTQDAHSEAPDHDRHVPGGEPSLEQNRQLAFNFESAPPGRFEALPGGARAGICLHALFEEWDYSRDDASALESLCGELLEQHGFDPGQAALAADLVQTTLHTPMTAAGSCLYGLPPQHKRVELEFTFRLQPWQWPKLAQLLADPRWALPPAFVQATRALASEVPIGYLKGFIDLACQLDGRHWVLDWKSNRLPDYGPASIEAEMAHAHYYLQALIYCVALHRYLRWRLPDYDPAQHFGGAIYVFLRGVPKAGIWRYQPKPQLLDALEALLCE